MNQKFEYTNLADACLILSKDADKEVKIADNKRMSKATPIGMQPKESMQAVRE